VNNIRLLFEYVWSISPFECQHCDDLEMTSEARDILTFFNVLDC